VRWLVSTEQCPLRGKPGDGVRDVALERPAFERSFAPQPTCDDRANKDLRVALRLICDSPARASPRAQLLTKVCWPQLPVR